MADKWMQGASKHPGAYRKYVGVKKGQKIPLERMEADAKKPGHVGAMARLALRYHEANAKK